MKNRVLAFLVVFSALLCIVAPLAAQDDAGTYFRVALWDVKRTHWSSYEENFTKKSEAHPGQAVCRGRDHRMGHNRRVDSHRRWVHPRDLVVR